MFHLLFDNKLHVFYVTLMILCNLIYPNSLRSCNNRKVCFAKNKYLYVCIYSPKTLTTAYSNSEDVNEDILTIGPYLHFAWKLTGRRE